MTSISRLSTEEVMRVAMSRLIQFSSESCVDRSMLNHLFGSAPHGLSDEETKDVELAHLLLASAQKVDEQKLDLASKFLNLCDFLSSNTGNSVQRVVHYFTKALQERIDRETGRITSKGLEGRDGQPLHPEETMVSLNPVLLIACFQTLPFYQVTQFAGIQAIVDSVASAKKVHLIDLAIRSGVHCTVLMQALATRCGCPLELLKITAVGTTSKQNIEETGKRLTSFAETLNLSFSFNIAIVTCMKDLNEDIFELTNGEVVVVYSPLILRNMITKPDCLEVLLRVLRNLNPCVMVVTEVEANHNSSTFAERFMEALFCYSAFFDCLEFYMARDDPNRMTLETMYLRQEIRNIVATEGEERIFRHMKIDGWRALLARFGMVETELSMSSLYQADLVVKNFACGSSCTRDCNGKCLTIGWKGTPILSLSAWKFHKEKE